MNANKQLIVLGEHGIAPASIEDLVASRLNEFLGWHCEAGTQNLYIDFDGQAWVANCASAKSKYTRSVNFNAKPWGYLGSINTSFSLPTTGVTCPNQNCGCGSDIVITKWKSTQEKPIEFLNKNFQRSNSLIGGIGNLTAVKSNYPMEKQVLWDIGRRCNYNCSYCWPGVHNTTDEHKTLAVFSKTADYIIDQWADSGQVRWYFGGGEPTLNPDFEPFVDYLSSRNQWVMLVSNGSQGPAYWTKNADNYNTLIFSAHFEFMKPELFAKNYSRVVDVMNAGAKKLNRFIVKLMTKPGEIEKSKSFVEQLKNSCGYNNLQNHVKGAISFDMVPLRDIVDGSKLHGDYTPQELADINKFNQVQ